MIHQLTERLEIEQGKQASKYSKCRALRIINLQTRIYRLENGIKVTVGAKRKLKNDRRASTVTLCVSPNEKARILAQYGTIAKAVKYLLGTCTF